MAAIMRQVWLMAGLALVMLAPAARSGPWPQAEGAGSL